MSIVLGEPFAHAPDSAKGHLEGSQIDTAHSVDVEEVMKGRRPQPRRSGALCGFEQLESEAEIQGSARGIPAELIEEFRAENQGGRSGQRILAVVFERGIEECQAIEVALGQIERGVAAVDLGFGPGENDRLSGKPGSALERSFAPSPERRVPLLQIDGRPMTEAEIKALVAAGRPHITLAGDRWGFERLSAAIWHVACNDGPGDRELLRQFARAPKPYYEVAYALAVLGEKEGVELFVRLAEEENQGCSIAVINAAHLLALQDPRGVRLWFGAFDRDQHPQVCIGNAKETSGQLAAQAAKVEGFDFVAATLDLLKRDPKIFGDLVAELLAQGSAIEKWRAASCKALRTMMPEGESSRYFVTEAVRHHCSAVQDKSEALWHWLPSTPKSAQRLPTKEKTGAAGKIDACKNRFAPSPGPSRSIWLIVDGREMTNAEIRALVAAGIPKLGTSQSLSDAERAELATRDPYSFAVWNVACADEPGDRELLWKVARSAPADDPIVIYPLAALGEPEALEMFARLAEEEKGGCGFDFSNAASLMALEDARGVRLWFGAFDRDTYPELCLRGAEITARDLPAQAAKIEAFDYVATLLALNQRNPPAYGDLVAQLLARGAAIEKYRVPACTALRSMKVVAPRIQSLVSEDMKRFCAERETEVHH